MLPKFLESLLDSPEVPAILLVAAIFTIIRSVTSSNKRKYEYYEISATFKDAKPRKGIRATVYKCAEKYHGRYRNNVGDSIFYPRESNDFKVHLRFERERDAQDFLVELSRLRSDHHRFHNMIDFDREPLEVSVSNKSDPIFYIDYVTNDSTYPECLSLADLKTDISKLTTVIYDPLIGLCSFEDFSLLAPGQRLNKCHIASKSGHPQYAKDVDNNIIYATQDFYNYFDGVQTTSGDAEMVLQYDGFGAEVSVPVDVFGTHENRCKVFVRIIFRDEAIAAFMKGRFRDYTEVSALS